MNTPSARDGGPAGRLRDRLRGLLAPASLILVLGAVYVGTLLPGAGHSHDTAEAQFSVPLLCVTHPTGYPTYLLLGNAFLRLVPFGTPAYRANLLSAVYGVLACFVLRRLLRRLGAREAVAWAVAVAFGLTPTFWRISVVAEMYSLNLLFVALVTDALLKWRRTRRDRDLLIACAWYVLSFGNHLTMVLVLPAFVFFVAATRWRVLIDWKLACAVLGLIALGLVPYAYPLVRTLDPSTPYLSFPVSNLGELWSYMTGATYDRAMFAFTTPLQLLERTPLFAPYLWRECGLFIPFALVGLLALADRTMSAYLGLVSLGHLAFALGFDGGDVDNYYIPIYLAVAALAAVGLERLLSTGLGRRVPGLLCLALPLLLGLHNRADVESGKGAERAQPMRELLEVSRSGALIIARYNDYMYGLYYALVEGKGGPSVYLGNEIAVADIVAYLRDGRPVYLAPLRRWAPAGLPVYSTQLDRRPALKAAGLQVRMVRPGVFRITPSPAAGTSAPGIPPARAALASAPADKEP